MPVRRVHSSGTLPLSRTVSSANLAAQRLRAHAQLVEGLVDGRRRPAHAELDVATSAVLTDRRQAEDADVAVLALDPLHQRRERRLGQPEDEERALAARVAV